MTGQFVLAGHLRLVICDILTARCQGAFMESKYADCRSQ